MTPKFCQAWRFCNDLHRALYEAEQGDYHRIIPLHAYNTTQPWMDGGLYLNIDFKLVTWDRTFASCTSEEDKGVWVPLELLPKKGFQMWNAANTATVLIYTTETPSSPCAPWIPADPAGSVTA